MIKNEDEVKEFLLKFPAPLVVTATTIRAGFVSCIKPIPTICGAELHCSPVTKPALIKVIGSA